LKRPHSIELFSSLTVLSILIILYNTHSIFLIVSFFLISLLILVLSGDTFFDNAVPMFREMGIGDMYAGTIFIGLASVLDEIALSVSSLIFHHPEIGIGAVEGSNFITMIFFTAIVALIYLKVVRSFMIDMTIIMALAVISIGLSIVYNYIPWYLSTLLFVPFIIYVSVKAKGNRDPNDKDKQSYSAVLLILAFVLIFISSDVLVRSTIEIARYTGISAIALSVYGIGLISSLPEIIMILVSLMGGRKTVSMGIFTGSTVYKMSLIPGFIALAEPTGFREVFYLLLAMLIMSSFVLTVGMITGRKYRKNGS